MTGTKKKTNTKRKISFDSDRLRRLMKEYKVTQEFLAKIIHVSYPSLKKDLQHGKTEPEKLDAIADYFTHREDAKHDVSFEYLQGDDMKEPVTDPDGNLIDYEYISGPTDQNGIPYGEYWPYRTIQAVRQAMDEYTAECERADYLFNEWLKSPALAFGHLNDDGSVVSLSNYLNDDAFNEYGLLHRPDRLREVAINAIRKQVERDYETLRLMQEHERKKGR